MSLNEDIFKAIFLNNVDRLQTIFVDHNIGSWNLLDKRGMAPLHYAAFRGNLEIVSWLVAQGSDVNFGKQDFQNSPLHFAALNGNIEVCRLLLDSGARKCVTNNNGHTASQIASDTGNHQCAILIDNYMPKEEVTRYTIPESTESEPMLTPALAEVVYEFIMMTDMHPVKVVFELPPVFLVDDNALKIFNVLHLMSKLEFNKTHKTKEMLSFKFHYLATILFEIAKPKDGTSKKPKDLKDGFLQKISESHNYLEQFLHDCIVKFCFKDSIIFRKMVSYMTRETDRLTALQIIRLVIGNKHVDSSGSSNILLTCGACDDINVSQKCPKCKTLQYCNRKCLRIHSAMHKKACKQIREDKKALESSNGETSALTKFFSKLGFK